MQPKVIGNPRIPSYQRACVSGQVSVVAHVIYSWARSLMIFLPQHATQHLPAPSSTMNMSQRRKLPAHFQFPFSMFYKQIYEVPSAPGFPVLFWLATKSDSNGLSCLGDFCVLPG